MKKTMLLKCKYYEHYRHEIFLEASLKLLTLEVVSKFAIPLLVAYCLVRRSVFSIVYRSLAKYFL